MDHIKVSSEKNKLNVKLIHDFISNSYWGKERNLEQTKKCIQNSLNFGIYINGVQIGYARVVTDYTLFAYLMDLFIIESERGKKYSIRLMNEIINHPELKNVNSWKLKSIGAQDLYRKYGFLTLEEPERMMEMNKRNTLTRKI